MNIVQFVLAACGALGICIFHLYFTVVPFFQKGFPASRKNRIFFTWIVSALENKELLNNFESI